MNTFDFRKQLSSDQLLIVRGTYERPDESTGADWNIEWSEISIQQNLNGIMIETDLLPFIKYMGEFRQEIENRIYEVLDDLIYLYIVERGEDD